MMDASDETNGIRTRYRSVADGDKPWIIFSHSLACKLEMWEPQIDAFRSDFNILAYDVRGHGESDAPPVPYSLDLMAADLLALIDRLGIAKCHFVGLSMGGMIGQVAALKDQSKFASLALVSTTGHWPADMLPMWRERIAVAEAKGMTPFAGPAVERWFTAGFVEQNPDTAARVLNWIESTPVPGFVGSCHAIPKIDTRQTLASLTMPVLIVVGSHDTGTPPSMAEGLKASRPQSTLVTLSGLRHLCNMEDPYVFNEGLKRFYRDNRILA